MPESNINNKRIAKNTLLLYFRMFLIMAITLYTSRVILQALGVQDYGVYNVVGGFVTMFGILTSSLSASISRYITVELGKKNEERLHTVFSTSIKIQILMSIVIAILAEAIGLWFLYNKMQIPDGRYLAAQWVLHCSILSFIISLIYVPYNSAIIAHEKMAVFAYISVFEAAAKLGIVYLLLISPFDRLISYAILLQIVHLLLFSIYALYCRRHFAECRGRAKFEKQIFKDMWSFAGWSLMGNAAYVFNTQGVNMVMNVFFGVVVNAARGIANQVSGAVTQFVNNFTMALNPQIIKSYASGDKEGAFILTCRGAKFSFLLMYTIALPIMLEADKILQLWLVTPPEGSQAFVIWTILAALTTTVGSTLLTLINAHGDIRRYQIYMTLFGFGPFPLTWLAYEIGGSVIWAYIIYFVVYYILIFIRLWLVHAKTGIPYKLYMKEAILRTHVVAVVAMVLPMLAIHFIEPSLSRLVLTFILCITSCSLSVLYLGFTTGERTVVLAQLNKLIRKIA